MSTYRAIVGDELGPPEGYAVRTLERRALRAGEVRVALEAIGVSYVDLLIASGGYQVRPPVPYVPGSEAAGIVIETGAGVDHVTVGDRVIATAYGGLFADEAVVPASAVFAMPEGLDFATAAVFLVSYTTAWHALVDRGGLTAGDTLLVLGAAGATGQAAVQIGRSLGAMVIASVSTPKKQRMALASGAMSAIDADANDWREQLKQCAPDGVDVVFDPVGGPASEPAFRSLAWRGRHLIVGFPAGISALRTNLPLLKGAALVGVDVRQFAEREPDGAAAQRRMLLERAAELRLAPTIGATFALADYRTFMHPAAIRATVGRTVIAATVPVTPGVAGAALPAA